MKIFDFMPTMFGQQFYPGGTPVSSQSIFIHECSIFDMYLGREDTAVIPPDNKQVYLKNYLLYFLNAPIWALDRSDLESKSIDDLVEFCYDNGLDPF